MEYLQWASDNWDKIAVLLGFFITVYKLYKGIEVVAEGVEKTTQRKGETRTTIEDMAKDAGIIIKFLVAFAAARAQKKEEKRKSEILEYSGRNLKK